MSLDFYSSGPLPGRPVLATAGVLVLLFLFASPVYAHKVHIFAYVDGNFIKTESRFNGGRPARNCSVNVHAVTGQDVVASGQSDEQGLFAFPVPNQASDLDIIITCGDGHRGSWLLEAQEYVLGAAEPPSHAHAGAVQAAPHAAPQVNEGQEALLRKIIAEEVDEKLAPMRRDLARLAERKTSLQDILGGIGYLLGLAGLAAYMKFKRTK